MMYVFLRISKIRSRASLPSLKDRILFVVNVEEML